ncbi:MAG: GNAT family N-acetyltransferase [Planctomycetes bacterium]|nr:GNAT family N-acetyltransferase [Planctomycetota bacterium]
MPKESIEVLKTPSGRRIELRLDGQAASWADLPYYRMRLGRATLTVGGVAGVGTRPEHRMKGYSRRVLKRSMEVMTEDGLDVSMLFGIPGYYHRFGYRSALSDYTVALSGRMLLGETLRLKARRLPPREHATVLPLYRRTMADLPVAFERSRRWERFRHGSVYYVKPHVVGFYAGKRLVGYMVLDDVPDTVRVSELATAAPEHLPSLLAYVGRQCRRKVVESAQFYLPPGHPASVAAAERGATFTRHTCDNRGGMMRVLNLEGMLRALQPELAARWSASALGAANALELTLQTDIGAATVSLSAAKPSRPTLHGRLRIPQDRLMQLAVGHVGARAIAQWPQIHVPARLAAPLAVLLPERPVFILRTDQF